jgi:energy-coupling factor transport system permease protein
MALMAKQAGSSALLILLSLIAFVAFGVDLRRPAKALVRLVPVLLTVALVQMLLIKSGNVLLQLGETRIVTIGGLNAAMFMAVRVGVIASCGFIIGSIGFSDFLLAMKAIRVPYELSFVSAMGAKLLPLLAGQMRDSLVSAQLRGANLAKMGLLERFRLYTDVLMPATVTSLMRAEQISWSLELKGFDPGKSRTYWRRLDMSTGDWLVFPTCLIALGAFLVLNFAR